MGILASPKLNRYKRHHSFISILLLDYAKHIFIMFVRKYVLIHTLKRKGIPISGLVRQHHFISASKLAICTDVIRMLIWYGTSVRRERPALLHVKLYFTKSQVVV